jgi:DNA-binding NtrC family response regulator
MDRKESILIVDDDESTRRSLTLIFGKKGYETETAGTGREAIEKAQDRFFNLALLDIKLPEVEGVELIAPLKEMHPDMVVIMATAYASLETAVRALNEGASAYITKPLNMDEVRATVREALEKQRLVMENRRLLQTVQQQLAELRQAEEVREKLIHELQDALAEIKTLRGILPICSSCKKIRDDEGYWHQVEVYIRDHSEAEFSHGLCPKCAKKLYPELFGDDE